MFKLEIVVDDKRLAQAMTALSGPGFYDLNVAHLRNAEPKGKQLREKGEGTAIEIVTGFLRKHLNSMGANVTTKQIVAGANCPYSSVMFALKMLVKGKSLTRVERGEYTINPNNL